MLSVVIPLYNKKRHVRRAVSSVLSQSFRDFEVIVVDDGSTDGSASEIESLHDDRLRVFRQVNSGEGAARNAGIKCASREWVAFLDADDEWLPGHLSELSALIDEYPNAGLVGGRTIELRPGQPVSQADRVEPVRGLIDYFAEASRRPGIVNSSSCAVRRDVLEALGGFGRAPVGCDTETWARVALMVPVVVSSKVTNLYHRGTDGVMERLEKENAPIEVSSLADVSPATEMLMRRMSDPALHPFRKSVGRYISAQAYRLMKTAMYRGQIGAAKKISKLILHRDVIPMQYKIALRMPTIFTATTIYIYRNMKRMSARLRP